MFGGFISWAVEIFALSPKANIRTKDEPCHVTIFYPSVYICQGSLGTELQFLDIAPCREQTRSLQCSMYAGGAAGYIQEKDGSPVKSPD